MQASHTSLCPSKLRFHSTVCPQCFKAPPVTQSPRSVNCTSSRGGLSRETHDARSTDRSCPPRSARAALTVFLPGQGGDSRDYTPGKRATEMPRAGLATQQPELLALGPWLWPHLGEAPPSHCGAGAGSLCGMAHSNPPVPPPPYSLAGGAGVPAPKGPASLWLSYSVL